MIFIETRIRRIPNPPPHDLPDNYVFRLVKEAEDFFTGEILRNGARIGMVRGSSYEWVNNFLRQQAEIYCGMRAQWDYKKPS